MAIRISKQLKDKLPEGERATIKDRLRDKSNGKCWLCDADFNEKTESLVADHEIPEAEGGPTVEKNLHLAHSDCNSIKLNYPSLQVRPYLRLVRFIRDREAPVYYSDCIAELGIKPKKVKIDDKGSEIKVHLPNGKLATAPVFEEVRQGSSDVFRFAFVELPKEAINHDVKCQPRSIKAKQMKLIYFDLVDNPLHEQPAVRVSGKGENQQLLLFDGQHKALAKWIGGNETVVTKVYLNLTQEQANYLVGSIQSRVKKLPLTPFELALKMSDEFEEQFGEYLGTAHGKESEAGFIKWLPASNRARGRTELKSALIAMILDYEDPKLEIRQRINAEELGITEPAFISKVLGNLVRFEPLSTEGDAGGERREHERRNVVRVLNKFEELCLAPGSNQAASDLQRTRTKRMLYQASLDTCMDLINQLVTHEVVAEDAFLDDYFTKPQMDKISQGIERIADHPIWTVDLEETEKTRRIQDALSKNQGAREAFKEVGLKLAYVVGVEDLEDNWKG